MISKQAVEEQLQRIGCSFRFWGRSEVNELDRILMEDEIIAECVNGEYANGFAMLLVTNHRLLLVDKKPLLYLTVEDVRYEMITEFNFHNRLLNASINVYTANKTLSFSSWSRRRLRRLLEYVQVRVLEIRQQQHLGQQFQAAAAAQAAQLYAAQSHRQYAASQQIAGRNEESEVLQQPQKPAGILSGMVPIPSVRQHLRDKNQWRSGRAALGVYTRSKLPRLPRYDRYPYSYGGYTGNESEADPGRGAMTTY